MTGHGADYIIVDDLMKAADAESEAELLRAQEFLEGTLMSRFNNPAEGRLVMIAQRLHEMDPPGCLLAKGTCRHLNLPAIAEQDEVIAIGGGRVHRHRTGEPLFPERMDLQALEAQRKLMGNAKFNCQYQQNPIAPDGSPLRWEWFGCYDEPLPRHQYQTATGSERRPRGRPKVRYGRAVTEALAALWDASDRVCSKRLKPMIPTLLPALERHGQIEAREADPEAPVEAGCPSQRNRRWLDSEPAITAVEVLARLKAGYPDRFTDTHLRTTQRMVRTCRADQARHIIRLGSAALEAAMATVTPPPSL